MNKKILLLGSGALSIGQAGEFDYSGSQAIRGLEDEGFEVIIINPNIATVQTNPTENRKVYLYPVTPEYVELVIKKERPQYIVGGFGGQTALNCLIELKETGILEKYNLISLGTSIETLKMTEDRFLFSEKLQELGIPTLNFKTVHSIKELESLDFKYPVISRSAYALGGLGSGISHSFHELKEKVGHGLNLNPQVIIEKYLEGWKEVEYEVLRDRMGNTICICNMENFDPLGVHTGDSIVVAPSQTLTNEEYQKLRDTSIKLVNSLEIVGECNVQFALNPISLEFYVIEVNARLSRSSALASKATGYPIAYIASRVVTGKTLLELKNPVTGTTSAFYEPALDYIAVKFPKWDLDKFENTSHTLSSKMKSVGEVMAIGRNFPETIQKAIRMVIEDDRGFLISAFSLKSDEELLSLIKVPNDKRIYAILEALLRNIEIEKIHSLSYIDHWFLFQLQRVAFTCLEISETSLNQLTRENLLNWKKMGFSDVQIICLQHKDNSITGISETIKIREKRKKFDIFPAIKKIDTTAAEYPARSNYLYFSYSGLESDIIPLSDQTENILILGSGTYRIGSSVEFDWCGVTASEYIKKTGRKSIVLNCNPETVSTDFNISDQLFFDEISLETILDIVEFQNIKGVICSLGGQVANKLATYLSELGIPIIGHSGKSVLQAENRTIFSKILDELSISQPNWVSATSKQEIKEFLSKVSFPILMRPSFVLSGTAMKVVHNKEQFDKYLCLAKNVSEQFPVILTEFMQNALELEVDGVAKQGKVLKGILSQHIENAGVHSGDATIVVPHLIQNKSIEEEIFTITKKIIKRLELNGPFNIQVMVKNDQIFVIEANVRSSRSFPFISKVTGINLGKLTCESILNDPLKELKSELKPNIGVKAAMFSFNRLDGVDPQLGVAMAATGEVGCIGSSLEEAFTLALEGTNIPKPSKGILLCTGNIENKKKWIPLIETLKEIKTPLFMTSGTHSFFSSFGISGRKLDWQDNGSEIISKMIIEGEIDLVINIPKNFEEKQNYDNALIRQTATKSKCSLITNTEKAILFMDSIFKKKIKIDQVNPL